MDLNVNNLGVDLMTVNGSKIYGPKGIGFLYKKTGVKIRPQIIGGGQEMRMRSGTENILLIVGMAKAFEIAQAERESETDRLTPLRNYFISEIVKKIPKVVLNGHAIKRLPNNVNVSILDIEGEALVLYMDAKGISFSTGSACTSESLDPSHVILALGKPYEFAHSSMRFTMGRSTTKEELDKYIWQVEEAKKRDHRKLGKELELFSVNENVGPGLVLWHPKGARIRLEIEDEGKGIPQEIVSKIFDPFFTTKDVGKGLGLGLSICHAIIEKHNGMITARSEPGKGSVFIVQLPKAQVKSKIK